MAASPEENAWVDKKFSFYDASRRLQPIYHNPAAIITKPYVHTVYLKKGLAG